ncbi:hypothetical protein [Actinoplanes sp. NPDC023714]|uniref:hypothetical protein n=1 Tax=Actinoplanes sp. NPDC023714 TaxID=3154322 RepID=UPI0033F1F192
MERQTDPIVVSDEMGQELVPLDLAALFNDGRGKTSTDGLVGRSALSDSGQEQGRKDHL